MADLYGVSIAAVSREEITGGRVGSFLVKVLSGGDYFIGGDSVDDTTGIQVPSSFTLYVTSPDEVYLYNQAPSTPGALRVFHNR
jgi:hypothetical protein